MQIKIWLIIRSKKIKNYTSIRCYANKIEVNDKGCGIILYINMFTPILVQWDLVVDWVLVAPCLAGFPVLLYKKGNFSQYNVYSYNFTRKIEFSAEKSEYRALPWTLRGSHSSIFRFFNWGCLRQRFILKTVSSYVYNLLLIRTELRL